MKKFIKNIAAVALLLGVSTAAFAQSTVEDNYPYNFITVQGGAQATLTHYSLTDLITPQVAISAGRYFNSKVGARLHVQGWQIKGGFQQDRFPFLNADKPYKFNAITGDIDLLMNMTNILNPNRISDKFDWVLLAGFGVNYAWDFDEFKSILPLTNNNNYYVGPLLCGTKHSTFNGRFGTQFNFNLSDNFAVGLELDANYKNDEFNLKRNYDPDWQVQALVGLTYKFGMKKKAAPVVVEPAPVVIPEPTPVVEQPKPQPVVEQPKPKPVVKEDPLRETFFYVIRMSDVEDETTLQKIVDWCNKYPQKSISVDGYADRGTGNPEINVGYAKARAEKVAKALQERGIAASRMTVNSYGDTVQPFPDNDRNRCVIVVGK